MEGQELEAVGIDDIEKMILLADDVLHQMEYNFQYYDNEGRSIYRSCEEEFENMDECYSNVNRIVKEKNEEAGFETLETLIFKITNDRFLTLNRALAYSVDDLLKKLEPLKKRIGGIFRHGGGARYGHE